MTGDVRAIRLGVSDLTVSAIGLGCWQFSGGRGMVGRFWPALPQHQVNAVVAAAVAGGVNWFDTAEAYGNGYSERSLTEALRHLGDRAGGLVLATKWWPAGRFAGSLRRGIAARREALGGRVIDLYQVHQRTSLSSLRAQMNALADLVVDGQVRAVGVSNFGAKAMRNAARHLRDRGIPLVSNQVRYHLLDRRIELNGVLEAAEELDVAVIAYSPLAQGILTGRFHEDDEVRAESITGLRRRMPHFRPRRLARAIPVLRAVRVIAEQLDCTPAQVALAWLIQRKPGRVVAIPGASTPGQVTENARSMSIELSADQVDRLDRVSTPRRSR